jgi:hypothetical protein
MFAEKTTTVSTIFENKKIPPAAELIAEVFPTRPGPEIGSALS